MPNYIVTGAKFDPFSMQELLSPAVMATQAHQDLENQLGDLSQKADVWQGLANEQTDPEAYRMYKTYADDLKSKVADLAANGLNPQSRQGLLDMKRRYNSEIVPIENAYNTRKEQIAAQQNLKAKGYILSRDAALTSLDDYMRNPALGYESYSGQEITNSVATAAKNLQRQIADNPETWKEILKGQYYEKIVKNGFSSDEIMKAVNGAEDADPRLTQLVNTALDQSGIPTWNNPQALARARQFANEGLWSALGTETPQQVRNLGFETAEQKVEREYRQEQLDILRDERRAQKDRRAKGIPDKAIDIGDGYIIPLGGNSYIMRDKDGNLIKDANGNPQVINGKETSEEKEEAELGKKLKGVTDVDGMAKLGFQPIYATVDAGGRWQSGTKSEDIGNVFRAWTPSYLAKKNGMFSGSTGNFSYKPSSKEATMSVVQDISTIPGFAEVDGKVTAEQGSAFAEIWNQAVSMGIQPEEFLTNDIQIMRVSGKGKRAGEFDYVIFRRQ